MIFVENTYIFRRCQT